MFADEIEGPFDSIESAQDFMQVLAVTVLDAVQDLKHQQQVAVREGQQRRAQAIELALFKAKTLGCHIHKSKIALNDLRTLRRLILNERLTQEKVMTAAV